LKTKSFLILTKNDDTPESPNKFATLRYFLHLCHFNTSRLKQKRTLSSVVQLTDEFMYKSKKTAVKLTLTQVSLSKLPFNPKG
jgi:hypothetical protein